MAVSHFEFQHGFRNVAARKFNGERTCMRRSRKTKGIGTSSRARIFTAGYNQLGGICRAGLYTNFVDKEVLSTFCVSNNKFGGARHRH